MSEFITDGGGEGVVISSFDVVPSEVQLFRFSAVTWNSHRIHYDRAYALEEGYADLVVHASLHAAFLLRSCAPLLDAGWHLTMFDYQVRGTAFVNERLRVVCRFDGPGPPSDAVSHVTVEATTASDRGPAALGAMELTRGGDHGRRGNPGHSPAKDTGC